MNLTPLLWLSAWLFSLGVVIVITRKSTILMLIGTELMLNAANINLIVFDQKQQHADGLIFALFIIVIAACEAAVGLAIMVQVYGFFKTSIPDQIADLRDQ